MCKIDLSQAFYTVPVHSDSRFLTTFVHQGIYYQFKRLPMGWGQSPQILLQTIKPLLTYVRARHTSAVIWCHVDDIIIIDSSDNIIDTRDELLSILIVLESFVPIKEIKIRQIEHTSFETVIRQTFISDF
jgi:hypothetical protein